MFYCRPYPLEVARVHQTSEFVPALTFPTPSFSYGVNCKVWLISI